MLGFETCLDTEILAVLQSLPSTNNSKKKGQHFVSKLPFAHFVANRHEFLLVRAV